MGLFSRSKSTSPPSSSNKTNNPKRALPRKEIPTIIDNERVDDLWVWILDTIDSLLKARDVMSRGASWGSVDTGYSSSYEQMVSRNYRFYRDLRAALIQEGANLGSGRASTNYLLQRMRNKYAMLLDNSATWRYLPGKPNNIQFVHNLNLIKNVEIERQGFYLARMEALAQLEAFGTAVTNFEHTITVNEPYGDDYFMCLDPLGFLFELGSRHINNADPYSADVFVAVKYRKKARMEREYGKYIDDGASNIEHRKFSVWHSAIGGGVDNADISEMMFGKCEEVTIFIRDETTDPVYEEVPSMIPIIDYTQSPPKKIGEEPEIGEDGQPKMNRVKTNRRSMRYRDYRKIVFSRNTILYDDIHPDLHGFIPYMILKNTESGIGPFGISDIDLGRDDQIGISEMQNAMNDSVVNMPGVMLMNDSAMVDPHKPFERNEDGVYVLHIDRLARGGDLRNVIEYKQPQAMSQDQLTHYANSIQNMSDTVGSQKENFGVSASADSGIKNEGQDQRVLRFHTPIMRQEQRNLRQVGVMWLSNLLQYGNRKKAHAVITPEGKPAMQELYSSLPDLKDAAYFGIEVGAHTNMTPGSPQAAKDMLEWKTIIPAIPDAAALRYSPFPELAGNMNAQQIAENEQRSKVGDVVQDLQQTGNLQNLEMAASNPAPKG